jgi:hypothetical protein
MHCCSLPMVLIYQPKWRQLQDMTVSTNLGKRHAGKEGGHKEGCTRMKWKKRGRQTAGGDRRRREAKVQRMGAPLPHKSFLYTHMHAHTPFPCSCHTRIGPLPSALARMPYMRTQHAPMQSQQPAFSPRQTLLGRARPITSYIFRELCGNAPKSRCARLLRVQGCGHTAAQWPSW